MQNKRTASAAAGLLGVALALACTVQPVPPEFQDDAVEFGEYRIGASDVLEVRVWKNPELSVEAPVLPDGTLSVPLVGAVSAIGLTTGELEDVVASRLSEYITAPEVSVSVSEPNSNRVSVVGEVLRSGWVPVTSTTRVMDAISSAGGFSPFANRKRIKIIRRAAAGEELDYRFDFDAFVSGKAHGTNVRLRPGDVIVVPD